MKVYILNTLDGSGDHYTGAYSTEAKAKAALAGFVAEVALVTKEPSTWSSILEFTIDDGSVVDIELSAGEV
jgi:hypothetical protein